MHVMHIALGGCLKAPPIRFGVTEDTGGHIAYVLGAAQAQAMRSDVRRVEIVTRAFRDPTLDAVHALAEEVVGPRLSVLRLASASPGYLDKDALAAELPDLEAALLARLTDPARRPDVIHAHFADAAALARAVAARHGIPYLYTPHSLGLDKRACLAGGCAASGRGPAEAALDRRIAEERAAIAGAAAIIVSSRDEAERQVEAYGVPAAGRTWRIRPGIGLEPPDRTAAARALVAPFLADPARPMILAIARPVRKKNLIALLEAYAADPALRARANLVILAGQADRGRSEDGEQAAVRRELTGRAAAPALSGHVALPPGHEPQAVPQIYRLAAATGGLFVNPALHEPFGLTLIEAARFGLPVVATARGGPPEILDTLGHGLLIDPTDRAALAAACHRLLDDRGLYRDCARNGRARQHLFSWDRWAEEVAPVMAEVRARRAAPALLRAEALFAFDMDDTLTGCAEGAAAFADWARDRHGRGHVLAVATGRAMPEVRRILADWALPQPDLFITSVGTEIWRWPPPRPDGARGGGALPGGAELCTAYAGHLDRDWARAPVAARLAWAMAAGDLAMVSQAPHEQRRWKLSYFGPAGEAARAARLLAEAGMPALVIASHGRFIDVLPVRSGKAGAIAFEADRLGLSLADCVSAGNSGNDADMLAATGRAILVGNALPEIAGMTGHAGLFRAGDPFARGVMQGLSHFGLAAAPRPLLAAE